jgi:hypothetical protein
MNNKTIKFTAIDKHGWEVAPKPFPASQALPDWFTSMRPYDPHPADPNGTRPILEDRFSTVSPKKCMPMMDIMLNGYIIPLWSDVQIRPIKNPITAAEDPYVTWRTFKEVFQVHGETAKNVEAPVGYSKTVFKYMNKWHIKTPPGYSVLVTQPFGYRQSAFHAVPAIIDSDKSTLELIFPMWIKEGFDGIVEKGHPMVQIIPFKRTDWNSEFNYFEDGEYERIHDANFGSTIVNHYIKKAWSKKRYS